MELSPCLTFAFTKNTAPIRMGIWTRAASLVYNPAMIILPPNRCAQGINVLSQEALCASEVPSIYCSSKAVF